MLDGLTASGRGPAVVVAGWGSGRRPNIATAKPAAESTTTPTPIISVGKTGIQESTVIAT